MYKFLARNGQLIAFGIGAILTVGFLLIVLGGIEGFNALAEEEKGSTSIFNFGLYAAVALTVLCFIVAVAFGLFQTVTNPKGAIKGLGGIIAIIAVFFIGQTIAGPDSASLLETRQQFGVSDGQSSIINGSLIGMLLLAAVAVAAFVIFEIRNFFK